MVKLLHDPYHGTVTLLTTDVFALVPGLQPLHLLKCPDAGTYTYTYQPSPVTMSPCEWNACSMIYKEHLFRPILS